MRKLLVLGFVSVGLLAGCGDIGEGIGLKESPAWHGTASAAVKQKHFQDQCLGFGFKLNTPELAQCIQNQTNLSRAAASKSLSDLAEQNRQRRARLSELNTRRAINRNTTTNCVPNGLGGFRCNTY